MSTRKNRSNGDDSHDCCQANHGSCGCCPSEPTPALVGKTISGSIRANGQISQKIEGDFTVTKSAEAPGVYTVRYNPPFAALIPGLPAPVMTQAFLPLVCNSSDFIFGGNANVFAYVLNYSPDGFKYVTFQIIDDQVIQKDLDVQFAAFGLVPNSV
ncbi:hypothetical protein [Bacillus badius]|uniref:Uncharacterized protein n=1 Tax=Bacillus badius TaxID=1455 RepID=A0ABR5AS70_BACBA|nr:hypothetical protein [Bacillus badius]KIL77499.1 hypothetical protein SD77_1485 [Bacillus badius]MED4717174.1 hypothetical protein [Bacillus badius]